MAEAVGPGHDAAEPGHQALWAGQARFVSCLQVYFVPLALLPAFIELAERKDDEKLHRCIIH